MLLLSSMVQTIFGLYLEYKEVENIEKFEKKMLNVTRKTMMTIKTVERDQDSLKDSVRPITLKIKQKKNYVNICCFRRRLSF